MDQPVKQVTKQAPWDSVNIFSKIFFTWVWPLYITGHRRDLQFNDLFKCPREDVANTVGDKLERQWNIELKKASPSFTRAMIRTFWYEFFPFFFIFLFLECVVRVSQPIFLGLVLRYLENPVNGTVSRTEAIVYATGIVLCSGVFVTLIHITFASVMRIGFRMRVACCTLMYRKSIKLSRSALGKTTVGQIVNIMSNDINRFDDLIFTVHSPVVSVIQSVLIMFMLWQHIRWACLTGIAVLVLFVPFLGVMGRLFHRVRRKTAALTDNRIRLMSEIVAGIRVIKMYIWETPFAKMVNVARKLEINRVRHASYLKAINLAIYYTSSKIILFACFVTYIYLEGPLKSESVFVAMAYFNVIRITFTKNFPNSIAAYAETYVSCKRIETFLLHEEIITTNGDHKIENDINRKSNCTSTANHIKVGDVIIDNASARWNKSITKPTFRNLNVQVKSGELLAIIGPVGSGKSSVLMALLNELPLESGEIRINGKISYAPQEAWVFFSSIRDNILFGAPYNERKYLDVVRVCALERDLQQLPLGDQTIVGERGVSLSGGQKTRVTLARALYNEADIYLLDDPLSAVDAHVSKHIFHSCINGYLQNKTRILVTHQLQYLNAADRILILKDDEMIACGTHAELKERNINFSSFISEKKDKIADDVGQALENDRDRTFSWSLSINSMESDVSMIADSSLNGDCQVTFTNSKKEVTFPSVIENGTQTAMIAAESKQSGSIKFNVYWQYFKACRSPVMMTIAFVATVVSQCLFQASDIWITEWTRRNTNNSNVNDHNHDRSFSFLADNDNFFVLIYSVLIFTMFICAIIRNSSFFTICMKSSINLHNTIFTRLLQTPMSHFDRNPSGRILNRFSKDMGIVDENLPIVAYELLVTMIIILGILLVNTYTNVYLIIPGILLAIFVIIIRFYYISAARDIKRLEAIARSPIFSHVNNTLTGLSTIRSFNAEDMFIRQFYDHQNVHSATLFLNICSARGFSVIMDWVCLCYISSVVVFVMLFPNVLAGYAGLALTSSLALTGITQWAVRCSADLESHMTSVERILEYTQLDTEDDSRALTERDNPLPKEKWPQNGEIVFDNLTLFYDGAAKPVLNGITFRIEGGTKVGVVGRTGAGKSSLISALFRLCRRMEGTISIDGIDITRVMLPYLRQRISIIPQEPLVFTGTVRYNLDPFGNHTDKRLWEVLSEVQMRDTIRGLPNQLDSRVSEGGNNFSVGQRQLICLARAILNDNKILVLDEATANVDNRTDTLIQNTIRSRFAYCTVITVAHRLHTIIDSDRILVLDAGNLIEFDTPYELLQRPNGAFTSLVKQTGRRMATKLINYASARHFGHQYHEENYDFENDRL